MRSLGPDSHYPSLSLILRAIVVMNLACLAASVYLENASGATVDRPGLLRLPNDARKSDVLPVESKVASHGFL